MSRRAVYSEKYSFHNSSVSFNLGGESIAKAVHGPLNTKDIEGATPKRFTTENVKDTLTKTVEHTSVPPSHRRNPPSEPRNPLQPEYKLASVPQEHFEVPKFVRDSMDVGDIAGTKPRPCVPVEGRETRNLDITDIEGTNSGWKAQQLGKLSLSDARKANLDVSDISGTNKSSQLPSPKKTAPTPTEAVEAAKIGTIQNREWKQKINTLRRQAGTEATDRRAAAESTLATLPPAVAADVITKISTEMKAVDRDHSGKLRQKEVIKALNKAQTGLTSPQIKAVAEGMAVESHGLVDGRELLASVYKQINTSTTTTTTADGTSPNENSHGEGREHKQPDWLAAKQRRLKTDVATLLDQQPTATAAAAATTETPSERQERTESKHRKRVEGLDHRKEAFDNNYWFATHEKNPPADSTTTTVEGSTGGGVESYWFAEDGKADESLKEMGVWRPTKDANFINAFNKGRKTTPESQKAAARTSTQGEGSKEKAGSCIEWKKPGKKRAEVRLEKQVAEDVAAVKAL